MEVDGGRVNCALAPGDRRSEHRLGELEDLARLRKPMQLQLAEDQLVVERHLEAPLTSRAQGHVDHHRGPSPEDLNRQTDGLFQVVSGNAVFDRDAVLGIDHVPSVSAIPTDGGRRSGQGTDQAVDGRADAVSLTQFCERLRIRG